MFSANSVGGGRNSFVKWGKFLVVTALVLSSGFFVPVANATISSLTFNSVGGPFVRGTTNITWSAVGETGDRVGFYYTASTFEGDTKLIADNIDYNLVSFPWDTTSIPNGASYKVKVQNMANAVQNSPSDTFTIDNAAPTTSIVVNPVAPNGFGWYTSVPTITLNCVDTGGSGCDKIYYSWSGTNFLEYVTAITNAPEGIDTLSYYSTDKAVDNMGAHNQGATQTHEFKVDIQVPTVALTYSANPAKAGAETITATYSEPIVGTPRISIDQPGTTDVGPVDMTMLGTDNKVWTYDYTVNTADGSAYKDGTATVSLFAVADAAGNMADAPSYNIFVIDTTSPTITGPTSSATVNLGTAGSFAALGTAVTLTNSTVTGNVGSTVANVSNTGSTVSNGVIYTGGAQTVLGAYTDFLSAYGAVAGLSLAGAGDHSDGILTGTLAGVTLLPGVYSFDISGKTGTLTLNADGNPDAVWIFKSADPTAGYLEATSFNIVFSGGVGEARNVFWWTGTYATVTTSDFQGTILSGAAITITGGTLTGRALATADVTTTGLNTITVPTSAPVSDSAPVADAVYKTNTPLQFTPNDSATAATCAYKIDSGDYVAVICTAATPVSMTIPDGSLSDGRHEVTIKVTDAAYNSFESSPVSFVFDDNNTLTVGPTVGLKSEGKSDFNNIQEAVTKSTANDTISVAAGTYAESLNITKGITLTSSGSKTDTTITGGIVIGADNVTIDDFTIDAIAVANGIYTVGHTNVVIQNNIIKNYKEEGILIDGGTVSIIGNVITGIGSTNAYSQDSIYTKDGATVTVTSNDLSNNIYSGNIHTTSPNDWSTAAGLSVHQGDTVTATGNTIHNNDFGVHAKGGETSGTNPVVIVHSNNIHDNSQGFFYEVRTGGAPVSNYDATSNWWGTAYKPTIQSKISGSVTFEPYYVDAAMTTLSGTPVSMVYVDDDYTDGGTLPSGEYLGYNAFNKVQDGITAVAEGGTVNVAAGTYNENVLIEKAINLLGEGIGITTIVGVNTIPPASAVIKVKNTGSLSSPVSIKGLTIDATFSSYGEGWGDGIYIYNSNYVTVEQNNIINSQDAGILIGYGSDNNVVKKNTITGSSLGSNRIIDIFDSENNMIGGADASDGNTLSSAVPGSGDLDDGHSPYLYGVNLSGPNSKNNTVQYNTITGGQRGVQVDDSIIGTVINNNTIYSTAGYAAVAINTGSIGATINNNYIHDNNAGGVAANAQTVEFSNNRILNNDFGIEMGATGAVFVLRNNSIVGNDPTGTSCTNPKYGVCGNGGGGGLAVYAGSVDAEKNYWGAISGPLQASTNPLGTGNSVSSLVDYSPWCTNPECTELGSNGPLDHIVLQLTPLTVTIPGSSEIKVTSKDVAGVTRVNETAQVSLSVDGGATIVSGNFYPSFVSSVATSAVTSSVAGTVNVGATAGGKTATGQVVFSTMAPTGISYEVTDLTGVAQINNTYLNGWHYRFQLTVNNLSETKMFVKFADWQHAAPISAQVAISDNTKLFINESGSMALVAGLSESDIQNGVTPFISYGLGNTFGSQTIGAANLVGDLNPTLTGRQVQFDVFTKLPLSTLPGAYSTTFGICTNATGNASDCF